jgi:hypothetical protein
MKCRVSSPEMHMQNRTAKFVSAIFASLLASAVLTTISPSAARAAEDCLSGPKNQAPQGGHWYYRIDHATKRHCWYLGEERERLSQTAPPNSSPSTKPMAPKTDAAMQRSISDAHAELTPPTRVEETSAAAGQRAPATASNTASTENSQLANAWDANTQPSLIASRWPEQSGLVSSASAGPTTANSGTDVQPDSGAAPPSVVAAVPLAAADSSSESPAGSIRMLLVVIAGALAFAGITGATVFRFGRIRQAGRHKIRGDRRAIWDSADTDHRSPAPYTRGDVSMRRADIHSARREADDASRRIAEMLTQLRRSAAN